MIQEGNIGLLRAAKDFKPELGFMFSTFATQCIHHAILNKVIHERQYQSHRTSLESQHENIEGNISSWEETIGNWDSYEMILKNLLVKYKHNDIKILLSHFPKRSVEILMYRYGLINGQERTPKETAEWFGISTSRVHEAERELLVKIRMQLWEDIKKEHTNGHNGTKNRNTHLEYGWKHHRLFHFEY